MFIFGPPDIEKMRTRRDVKGLIKALGYGKDRTIRLDALRALGKLGDPRAVEPLIAVLKDKRDFSQGSLAAEALGQIGDNRAIDPLLDALKHGDRYIRDAVIEALRKISDPRALIAALSNEDLRVRLTAEKALGEIGTPAIEPLIFALNNERNWAVRRSVVQVLGKIGDAPVLIPALKDGDSGVRSIAAEALGKIDDARAVEPLITALKDKNSAVRSSAAEALNKLKWIPQNDDARIVYWIANKSWEQVASLGAPAVKPLITALKDEDTKGRKAITEALGKLGDARAVEPLITELNANNEPLLRTTIEALKEIGTPTVVPLIAQLKNPDMKIRQWAAEILGEIGDIRAVELLNTTLQDTDTHVRLEAAKALAKFSDVRAFLPLWTHLKAGEMFKADAENMLEILIEMFGQTGTEISDDILKQMMQTNSITVLIQTGEA